MPTNLLPAVALLLVVAGGCKKDETPPAPGADARAARPADARLPAPDAARTVDASAAAPAPDAAAALDAGPPRRKPVPPDAGRPIDAAPARPALDAGVASGTPCRRTSFDTTLVADACAAGGQAEAKKAMKAFVKNAKKQEPTLECKSCHTKLAPDYPLKDDGLESYQRLGGK